MSILYPLFLLAVLPVQDDISQSISDSFEVRMITIEVVVTDREGNRVSGLNRDEFKLLVDGTQVDPSFFQEIREQEPVSATGEPNSAPPNYFLVFVDDYYTQHLYRKPMFKRLFTDLENLGPKDKMAVVRYMGKELEPLIGWTSNKEALRETLLRVRKMKTGQMQREMRVRMSGRHGTSGTKYQQLSKTVSSISQAMRGFYIPGVRQNLIMISSGWPVRPSYQEDNDRFLVSSYGGVNSLRPITDTANLLGYTIYPMQLQLLGQGGNISSQRPTGSGAGSHYYSRFAISLDSLSFLADEVFSRNFHIVKKQFRRI